MSGGIELEICRALPGSPHGSPMQRTRQRPMLVRHQVVGSEMRHSNSSDSLYPGQEDLNSCLLCLESFRNPKVLDCQHAFCEHCLQFYYKTYHRVQQDKLGVSVPCPTCRKQTKVPDEGLHSLDQGKNNVRLAKLGRKMSTIGGEGMNQRCDICIYRPRLEESDYYCGKCHMNLCSACKTAHSQHNLFKNHPIIHISNKETINLYCDKHNKLPSIYYCLDCDSVGCTVCIVHEHSTHNAAKLWAALSMKRDMVKTLLNTLGPSLDRTEAKVKKLAYLNAVQNKGSSGLARSQSAPGEESFNSPVARRISTPVNMKTDNHFTENGDLESTIQSMYFQVERVRRLYDSASKLLEVSQSKRLLAVFEDLLGRLQSVLEVETKQLVAQTDGLLERQLDIMNQLLSQISASSADSMNTASEQRGNSSCSTDESSSLDDISVLEPHPQSLLIKPKLLWKMEKHRSDAGELWNPCDLSFLENGHLVVAEYDTAAEKTNHLRIFDNDGKAVQVVEFDKCKTRPLGVTTTQEGNIAITDCTSKRIKIYSPNGQFIQEWGKGQFGWPYGITVNGKGQYIVSDAFNDIISIHAPDGKRLRQFGSSGSNSNQFKNPYHVAVDAQDNIIVSDCGNNCVKVFDINGKFLFRSGEIRTQGMDSFILEGKRRRKRLRAPRGVTVDVKGNILVADDNSRVCMFDSHGKYVRKILTEEDSVKYAEGLAMHSNGCLGVTEWNPNNMFAIKVFTLYE